MQESFTKKKYIEITCQMMLSGGVDSISARKIADVLGCAQSAIYKHFRSMDELMIYASFRYLHDYYCETDRIASKYKSSLSQYLETEKYFARYSFENPVIFHNLYFGKYRHMTPCILQDFLTMYRSDLSIKDYTSSFKAGGLSEDNRALIMKCIKEGSLTIRDDQIDIVNNTIINLYKGFLKGVLDDQENANPDERARQYLDCFNAYIANFKSTK